MKKRIPFSISAFTLILALLLSPFSQSVAKIIYVGPGEEYDNIKWGLANASAGDTVMVRDGVYVQDIKVRAGVVLMAEHKHGAVIGDGTEARALISIVQEPVDGAVIDGFKFAPGDYNAIFVGRNVPEEPVQNCIIRNNLIEGRQSGIVVSFSASHTTIEGNTIRECSGAAISHSGTGDNLVSGNTMEDCGLGIFFAEVSGSVTMTGNTIRKNEGVGVEIERSGVTLENNLIEENLFGIGTNCGHSGIVLGDSNRICNNVEQGIIIESGTQATIEDNIIQGNGKEGINSRGICTIRGNEVTLNGENGIMIQSGNTQVENNIIKWNQIHGIEIAYESEWTTITGNTIMGNQVSGIIAGQDAKIKGNLIDSNGEFGIQVYGSAHNMEISDHNTVSNNLGSEIRLDEGSTTLVKQNTIEHGQQISGQPDNSTGIHIEGSARIIGNMVRNISGPAILVHENAGEVVITDKNTIQDCIQGIVLTASAEVIDNEITDNLEQGIRVERPASDVRLAWNEINGNRVGIFYQSEIPGLTISHNRIKENENGIVAGGEATVRSNTIQFNSSCGIKVRGKGIDLGSETDADSGMNAILDNGEWNLWNVTPDTVVACYNFWGSAEPDTIDASIQDDEEDEALGPVIFTPFLGDLNVGINRLPGAGENHPVIGHMEVFPNPAGRWLTVRFSLRTPLTVHMKMIDPGGREAGYIIPGIPYTAGEHRVTWDLNSMSGYDPAEGLFFVVLEAGKERTVKKVILQRKGSDL